MDRNYCFRRKRHSYPACDAAFAASIKIIKHVKICYYQKLQCSGLTSKHSNYCLTSIFVNLKFDHGKIALFTLHTHTHLRLLYNKDY